MMHFKNHERLLLDVTLRRKGPDVLSGGKDFLPTRANRAASKNHGYLVGGPLIRILVYWGLCRGPLILGLNE